MPSGREGINIKIEDFILPKYTEAKPLIPNLEVVFEDDTLIFETEEHAQKRCVDITHPFARCEPHFAPILRSQTLFDGSSDYKASKSITEITLGVEQNWSHFDWHPGDTVGVIPSNAKDDVEDLLNLLGLREKSSTQCRLEVSPLCKKKSTKVPVHIPSPTTPKEILQDCLNLKSVLKKQFISSLSDYCSNPIEKIFLKSLSSKEATHFYQDLLIEKGVTLVDILKLCPTCKPPMNLIVEYLSKLQPRPYSIANSPLSNSKEIKIIFSTLKESPGVTTRMLGEKTEKLKTQSILIYPREPNLFRFTEKDITKNQILIAIGTGLAPFLGFLEHKQHLASKGGGSNEPTGQTWLFVGAKTQKAVIYREKLIKWKSIGVLTKFEEAFSQEESSNNIYVQNAVEKCHDFANFLLHPQTLLYLCADGGGKISKCIENSIGSILEKELGISDAAALQMLREFKTTGKIIEDLWL